MPSRLVGRVPAADLAQAQPALVEGTGQVRTPQTLTDSVTLLDLVLPGRRHHVLWHRGTTTLTDLHAPWRTHHHGSDPPAA